MGNLPALPALTLCTLANVHDLSIIFSMIVSPHSGQRLARGACRLLGSHNFNCVTEFVPTRGLRVDVFALGPKGEIWIIECKSSRADFQSDTKWQGYLAWCDRYFWAVDSEFDTSIIPENNGLIIADGYGGEITRMAPLEKLAPARRKSLTLKFARTAAQRLNRFIDPKA